MTVAEALRYGTGVLATAGLDTPGLDARLLLAHAMGIDPSSLIAARDRPADLAAYLLLLARRSGREPLAYITGRQGFWSLDLDVSPATLIPRADTETLIEAAIALSGPVASILDLGTGTGCLLLAALTEFPRAFGVGVDRDPAAVALARHNAAATGLAARAAFMAGDWATAIDARFDLILSNPPYINTANIPGLMPEVAEHEPRLALDGGTDGLDAYRAIIGVLPGHLTPRGQAVLELGSTQYPAVAALARAQGLSVSTKADLSGHTRAIILSPMPATGTGQGGTPRDPDD